MLIDSIKLDDNERLVNRIRNNLGSYIDAKVDAYLAGGAITSLLLNKQVSDYDIYPASQKGLEDAIMVTCEDGYMPIAMSDRAITFANGDLPRIQIMTFDRCPTAKDIFRKFDFTVCMAAFNFADNRHVHMHSDYLLHNAQRIIQVNPDTEFPYASLRRVRKYRDKGFFVPDSQVIKLAMVCAKSPITSWEEFERQLGGFYAEQLNIPKNEEDDAYVPFTVDRACKLLDNIDPTTITIFDDTDSSEFPDAEELILMTSDREFEYATFGSGSRALVKFLLIDDENEPYIKNISAKMVKRDNFKHVGNKAIFGDTFYKTVFKETDTKFKSIYERKFEYELGEVVRSAEPYIFVETTLPRLASKASYKPDGDKRVVIELKVATDDDIVYECGQVKVSRAMVVREVPYAEYKEATKPKTKSG